MSVYDSDAGTGVVEHKIEDGNVLASASELWMTYIYDLTDPNDMSPTFREALACLLAKEAAITLAQSRPLWEAMDDDAKAAVRRARAVDSQSDLPRRMPVGSWSTARHGRVGSRSWPE